jgi:hypothetical protein
VEQVLLFAEFANLDHSEDDAEKPNSVYYVLDSHVLNSLNSLNLQVTKLLHFTEGCATFPSNICENVA